MKPHSAPTPSGDAVIQFVAAMTGHLLRREMAGGALPEQDESEAVAKLETLWWELSDQEQAEAKAQVDRVPEAPESLGLVDIELALCETRPPRKKLTL